MRALLLAAAFACAACGLIVTILVVPVLVSTPTAPTNEDDHSNRRRLRFFDPKTVEYKDGALKRKNPLDASTLSKGYTSSHAKKSDPLFKEEQDGVGHDGGTSSQKYKEKKKTTHKKIKQTQTQTQTQAPLQTEEPTDPVSSSKTTSSQAPVPVPMSAQVPVPYSSSSETALAGQEPSYMQLCRELLRRTTGDGPKDDHFIVHESPEICASQDSYAALGVVMLSATIAQAGSKVRLSYQHGCVPPANSNFANASIQQALPRDVTLGVGIGLQPIADKCTTCLAHHEERGRNMVECMGIPNAGAVAEPIDPMTTSFRIAGFRHNIQQAVQDIRMAEVAAGLPLPTYGGAVIVLDLESEVSGRAWALPLYYYQEILPSSISSIAILVTQRCIDATTLCQKHGQLLAKGLQQLYPDATMHGEILSSTATAYSRILDAPQLICPPTLFCLLPSLYSEYSKASYHVMNNNLYEWFKFVARENRKLMGKQLVVVEPEEVKPKPLVDLETLEAVLNRERPTLTTSSSAANSGVRRRRLTSMNDPKTVVYKQPASTLEGKKRTSVTNEVRENDAAAATFVSTTTLADDHSSDPNTIPSYVHLCRELLNRQQKKRMPAEVFVVHESPQVCNSPDSFQSLVTMLISSIVSHAGSILRISYQHNCEPPRSVKTATIQQLLPSTLSISKGIGLDAALERCAACTSQIHNTVEAVQCFGFPIPGPMSSPPTGAALLIPHFRHNVEAAVKKARQLEAGDRPPTNAGVVIYLDTETETGTDVYQASMKYYAEVIPRDISSISIVVSGRCAHCAKLSAFTMEYLHMMYPTAKIVTESVLGSAIAYARVMEAPFTVCSPSLFCVLPSLLKEFSHKSHVVSHPGAYPWFQFLATESGDKLNKSIFIHDDQAMRSVGHLSNMKEFLFQQVEPTSAACANLRGRLGEWTYDVEYAKFAQYATPLKRFRQFAFEPTAEQPYRLATSYRWVDALCPVYLMERDHLCSTMNSLDLTRIYIVGDSLALQMAQSLWKMLGHEDDPFTASTKTARFHWSRSVECPTQQLGFEIVYTRNDLLDNNDEKNLHERIGVTEFNCGYAEFCMPWIRNFAEYKGGTLLVANVGTHVHDIDIYRKYLDDFFALMDGYQKPNDVVMFRTTVPGHENCQNANVAPLGNYDEYLKKHFIADFKSYQLFPTFNRMLEERVRARRKDNIQVLDVVPMTILRPDGHTSGPQKCSTCKDDDCLHYSLPGPPDWWNNLMYSNLASAAMARNQAPGVNGGALLL